MIRGFNFICGFCHYLSRWPELTLRSIRRKQVHQGTLGRKILLANKKDSTSLLLQMLRGTKTDIVGTAFRPQDLGSRRLILQEKQILRDLICYSRSQLKFHGPKIKESGNRQLLGLEGPKVVLLSIERSTDRCKQ